MNQRRPAFRAGRLVVQRCETFGFATSTGVSKSTSRSMSVRPTCAVFGGSGSAGYAPPNLPRASRVASHDRPQASCRSRGSASEKPGLTPVSIRLLLSQNAGRRTISNSPMTPLNHFAKWLCDDFRRILLSNFNYVIPIIRPFHNDLHMIYLANVRAITLYDAIFNVFRRLRIS